LLCLVDALSIILRLLFVGLVLIVALLTKLGERNDAVRTHPHGYHKLDYDNDNDGV
jgi:hypothetical protein